MMDEIGKRDLYKLIQNKKLDYAAYVMTQWHVHSFEAAVKMVEERENKQLTGVVLIIPHPINGYMIDEKSFSRNFNLIFKSINDESVLDFIRNEVNGFLYYYTLKKSERNSFYVFRPTGFRYPILGCIDKAVKKEKRIVVVKLDEGTGTYLNKSDNWLKIELSENKGLKQKIIVCIKHLEEILLKYQKIEDVDQYLDACLFKLENNRCATNRAISNYYKEAIEDYAKQNKEFSSIASSKYIIINTQISENMFKTGNRICDELLKDCIKLFQNKGYEVFLKPHPRETNADRYKCFGATVITNNSISQECLLAMYENKPEYIIGFFSTSLITANALFGIKSLSLDDLVMEREEFKDRYVGTVIKFRETFYNNVQFISTIEELEKII